MGETAVNRDLVEELVIRAGNTLDFLDSAIFGKNLLRAVKDAGRVLIDLTQVDFMDSTAILGLTRAFRRAASLSTDMVISGISPSAERVIRISGLGARFGLNGYRVEAKTDKIQKPDLRRQDWRITESVILADSKVLASLRDIAVSAACDAGLDELNVFDVQLAVTEAVVNAFQHGSPVKGKSKIRVRCLSCRHAFIAEVIDEGIGVNPDTLRRAEESYNESGVGLRLITRSMNETMFYPRETEGVVRMTKWLG